MFHISFGTKIGIYTDFIKFGLNEFNLVTDYDHTLLIVYQKEQCMQFRIQTNFYLHVYNTHYDSNRYKSLWFCCTM